MTTVTLKTEYMYVAPLEIFFRNLNQLLHKHGESWRTSVAVCTSQYGHPGQSHS